MTHPAKIPTCWYHQASKIGGFIGTWLWIGLSGAVMVFAFAPYRYVWIAPFSLLVPILLAQSKPTHAFRIGYCWALTAYGVSFHWIYHSLFYIVKLPWYVSFLVNALFICCLALYPALAWWLTCLIKTNRYNRWLLIFPALWTLSEWLRGLLFTGFSWGEVGLTQIAMSPLASLAPIFGIHGVTWALVFATGLLALLWYRPAKPISFALVGFIILLCVGTYSMKAWDWTTPVGKPVKVALAQGNVPQSLKWDPIAFEATLRLYSQLVNNTQADIMILPETALPTLLEYLPPHYWHQLQASAKSRHMALAVGILQRAKEGGAILNTVITSTDHRYYAKHHLVPFVEYLPFKKQWAWLYQTIQNIVPQCQAGDANQAPLTVATQKIAFNICYEDAFGAEIIGSAKNATLLANISNLAWFGKNSIALGQQLQLSQARALENGRSVLRATNTGMTAIISPHGTITAIVPPDTRQVLVGMSQGYTGCTPYMRYGNYPILGLCGLLLFIGMALTKRTAYPTKKPMG